MNTQINPLTLAVSRDKLPVSDGDFGRLQAGNRVYLLCRHNSGFVAFRDQCPHKMQSFIIGDQIGIDAGCIVCPHHGAYFDLQTGAMKIAPRGCTKELSLHFLPVNERGDALEVVIGDDVARADED